MRRGERRENQVVERRGKSGRRGGGRMGEKGTYEVQLGSKNPGIKGG